MAIEATLVYVLNDGRVLLKKATRGITKSFWNGLGGKLDNGESPEQCARREVFEESGLSVDNLFYHGTINFHNFGKEEVDFTVHLYSTSSFEGIISASQDEGELRWFPSNGLPTEEMRTGDRYFVPLVLQGKKFDADFYYDQSNTTMIRHEIKLKEKIKK